MVQVYSKNVTVQPNETFPLNVVIIEKGSTATTSNNSINLNCKGVYAVDMSASLTPATSGDISVQLYKNGVPYAPAESKATGTADAISALSFPTLIQCSQNNNPCCCCTSPDNLTLVNTSAVAVTGDFTIRVTKIC